MKVLFCLISVLLSAELTAASLPDNMYFRAMNDEMQRSKKELRIDGAAKPFFIVYKMEHSQIQNLEAQFGAPLPKNNMQRDFLSSLVYLYAGDEKENSSGFYSNLGDLFLPWRANIGKSYDAIRRTLWKMTNEEYIKANALYEKKVTYKKQKKIAEDLPDFSFTPKASYVEELPEFTERDEQQSQQLLNEITSLWPIVENVEDMSASFFRVQRNKYFLDSEGDFYVFAQQGEAIALRLTYRAANGHVIVKKKNIHLDYHAPLDGEKVKREVLQFLQEVKEQQNFKIAQAYIGPVLLKPQATGHFFSGTFLREMKNTKPFLTDKASNGADESAGLFKDRLGLRVISPLFDVYDKPLEKKYDGQELAGFMPIDDEGVASRELTIVKNGNLQVLPGSRSLMKGEKQSNGHAQIPKIFRFSPRAALTNVFFIPQNPVTAQDLESDFIEKCKKQQMPYCYILPDFSNGEGFLQRIYTQDGRKEWVWGEVSGLDVRSLRSISAAADDLQVYDKGKNIIAPSVIVEEATIMPTSHKPPRKPFVPAP